MSEVRHVGISLAAWDVLLRGTSHAELMFGAETFLRMVETGQPALQSLVGGRAPLRLVHLDTSTELPPMGGTGRLLVDGCSELFRVGALFQKKTRSARGAGPAGRQLDLFPAAASSAGDRMGRLWCVLVWPVAAWVGAPPRERFCKRSDAHMWSAARRFADHSDLRKIYGSMAAGSAVFDVSPKVDLWTPEKLDIKWPELLLRVRPDPSF